MPSSFVTVMFAPPKLVSFTDAAGLICPLLSRLEPGGDLTRVTCLVEQCNLWNTVVPPPGDKFGTCLGVCSLPKIQRDVLVKGARAEAARYTPPPAPVADGFSSLAADV